jgi:hypothetical protein
MEAALLHLLEDFHSGKLRAFGESIQPWSYEGGKQQVGQRGMNTAGVRK